MTDLFENKNKTQTDTKTKTKDTSWMDELLRGRTAQQPTVAPKPEPEPERQQRQKRPRPIAPNFRTQQPLPDVNFDEIGQDDISDEDAARISGRNNLEFGNIDPEPPTPTQQLAVIVKDIATTGGIEPDFHKVSELPGYMANAIRKIGRTVFSTYTTTPIEKIDVLANLGGGQGPNERKEINAVAGWARANARLDQQASEAATAEFGRVIPGYKPQLMVYDARGTTFMLVRDDHGDYVYSWPSSTNTAALTNDARGAALAAPGRPVPRLARESVGASFSKYIVEKV